MIVNPVKTTIFQPNQELFPFVTSFIPQIEEKTVIVITSKILALSQGRYLKTDAIKDKVQLIKDEADWYIDKDLSRFHIMLTIKQGILIVNAGIDESNGNGLTILWPNKLHVVTQRLWTQLREHYKVNNLGIIITDSRVIPLRWGTIGVGLSWCGFSPLTNYIGEKDIFGRPLAMTTSSVLDGLAANAVFTMGEGAEQTPLAIISGIPTIKFLDYPPTDEEINKLYIEKEDDAYAPILTSSKWRRGGQGVENSVNNQA